MLVCKLEVVFSEYIRDVRGPELWMIPKLPINNSHPRQILQIWTPPCTLQARGGLLFNETVFSRYLTSQKENLQRVPPYHGFSTGE